MARRVLAESGFLEPLGPEALEQRLGFFLGEKVRL